MSLERWQPGSAGKGLVLRDGRATVWQVDAVEGHPHHQPASEALGWDLGAAVACVAVSESGQIQFLPEPETPQALQEALQALRAADPRLMYPAETWRFNP